MSDISFGIRVVDEDGNGVEGAKVFVAYPWTHDEDYTDEDGWVQFERERTMHGGVNVDIYVNGDQVAEKMWIDEGEYVTYSYTI
ncbi:MAG: hypothetical protein K9J43_06255, partial [Polynucleobacter sp.]|nr:hypothetical protein [Polynucleobacter sp.]